MCFVELGDMEEEYKVCCAEIHVFLAMLVFLMADFWAIIITGAVYVSIALWAPSWHNLLPVAGIGLSAPFVPVFGIYGALAQNAKVVRVYALRCAVVAVISCIWTLVCVFFMVGFTHWLVAAVWFCSTLLYSMGYYFARRNKEFIQETLQGFM